MFKRLQYYPLGLLFLFLVPLVYQPIHAVHDHPVCFDGMCTHDGNSEKEDGWIDPFSLCAVCDYEIAVFDPPETVSVPSEIIVYQEYNRSLETFFPFFEEVTLSDPRAPPVFS